MAYEIKGAPFRYKGAINVEDCKTSAEVLEKSHLNWNVDKCELVAKINDLNSVNKESFYHDGNVYVPCPNAYATYRTDCNVPLGVVKGKYTPVQNIDAFKFFDGCIGENKAIWQTAGYFGNGERIFVSAKLPDNIFVNGDPVENYLVFTNSHDGSSGIKILFTPIRIVCQNTLNAAIKTATNYVSFRHTASVHDNIDQAAEILGICEQRTEELNLVFNEMNKKAMTDDQAFEYFGNLILTPAEKDNLKLTGHSINQIVAKNYLAIEDSEISMKKVNVISEMANYYFSGPGQKEIVGNAWGVYNAVTGYYSNVDKAEGLKRMDSILYGDKSRKIETFGNMLMAV